VNKLAQEAVLIGLARRLRDRGFCTGSGRGLE